MERYYNDQGQLAVIYDPSDEMILSIEYPELISHPELVQLIMDEEISPKTFKKLLMKLGYEKPKYIPPLDTLEIAWLEPGTKFRVVYTDANLGEKVEIYDPTKWLEA